MKEGIPGIFILTFLILAGIATGAITNGSSNSNISQTTNAVDWWPQFRHDPQLTGFSTSKGPNTPNVLWTYTNTSCGFICGGIAVVDNKVYLGSQGFLDKSSGALICLNASTGIEIWSYKFPYDEGVNWAIYGCPAVVDGRVYACVCGQGTYMVGHAYCFNAETGAMIWKSQETGFCLNGPTVIGGRIFFGTRGWVDLKPSTVYCLSTETGNITWKHEFQGKYLTFIDCAPAYYDDNVYVVGGGDTPPGAFCYNASTGEEIWRWQAGNNTDDINEIAVLDGYVYFGTEGQKSTINNVPISRLGGFYCLDASDGHLLWKSKLRGKGDYIFAQPSLAYGNVYVCSSGGFFSGSRGEKMTCFNNQGYVIWAKRHLTIPFSFLRLGYFSNGGLLPPAVADGKVYLGTASFYRSHLYCFNATSGVKVWEYTLPPRSQHLFVPGNPFPASSYFCQPTIADGKLFTVWGDTDGVVNTVYCFGDAK